MLKMMADVMPTVADVIEAISRESVADGIPLWQMSWIHSCVDKYCRWNTNVADILATILFKGIV